jgi:diguanylate cyclase (GGDEF)-like protein
MWITSKSSMTATAIRQVTRACLQKVGNAIGKQVTRQTDFVARYGGEEFVVLLPETDQTGAAAVAERIRQSVYELDIAHESGMDNRVTVSLGAASIEPSSSLIRAGEQLLVAADTALYASKSAGRNCVTVSEACT